ncbi:MAG: ABC transporter permease [Thermomicrobiales bacterium]
MSGSRSLWSRFAQNRAAVFGLAIVATLCLLAIVAPFFTVDPDKQNVPERMQSPNWNHWFGTDDFGRDLFSRVVNGARVSLLAGFISVAIGLIVGATIGVIAGYFQGRIGAFLMAIVDLLLALPAILLSITLAARLGSGLNTAMIAAGVVGIPGFARIARASTLSVNRREFTDAARALGASNVSIIRRHILPNIISPLIVQATVGIGAAILLVSALGFLGLGAQPPQAEWGRMLNDAKRFVFDAAYMGIFPGVAIALTVFGFNLAGDGLRDALDRR